MPDPLAPPVGSPLPLDILRMIITYAPRDTQSVMMRTSRQLYEVTGPKLYRRVPFGHWRGPATLFDGLYTSKPVQPSWSKKKPAPNRKKELLKHIRVVDLYGHEHGGYLAWKIDFQKLDYAMPNLKMVVVRGRCGFQSRDTLCPALLHCGTTPRNVCLPNSELADLPWCLFHSGNKGVQLVILGVLPVSPDGNTQLLKYPVDVSSVTVILDWGSRAMSLVEPIVPAMGEVPYELVGLETLRQLRAKDRSTTGDTNPDLSAAGLEERTEWCRKMFFSLARNRHMSPEETEKKWKRTTLTNFEEWGQRHKVDFVLQDPRLVHLTW